MRTVEKDALFLGGAASVAGVDALSWPPSPSSSPRSQCAWDAYTEQAAKAVVSLWVNAPNARHVLLSGRHATPAVRDAVAAVLSPFEVEVHLLDGIATLSKHAAQGAALMADGLLAGASLPIVERLGIRDAAGTVLDHLTVIAPDAARRRLGMS
jgi:predicted butyrate kinase (DUF1464 family)